MLCEGTSEFYAKVNMSRSVFWSQAILVCLVHVLE